MKYYSYIQHSKISKINSIQIKIASPYSIIKWGLRKLPNGEMVGEVKTAQTMNYKTLKPEATGLFCEKVFGPIKDFECACGKRYENEFVGFCAQCGVEFISSQVRRQRLGYIKLISPVLHIWYIKYISLLLNISSKSIESIVYCTNTFFFTSFYDSPTFLSNLKKGSRKKKLFRQFTNLSYTNFINNYNNKLIITIKYYLYIQKNLLQYLYDVKKNFFLVKNSYIKKSNEEFKLSYQLLTQCYGISYFSLWESKKKWNNIAFYMNCTSLNKDEYVNLITLYSKSIFSIMKEYKDKFVFGIKIIYNWLKFFDYNFQLINLEKQIRFHIFEIKEEIKEISSIIVVYFFENNDFQKNYVINLKKKVEKLHLQKNQVFRRLKLIVYFRQAKIHPRWMILSILPVLPPDLRPIVELGSNKIAVSDINKLYQTILLRNIRLKKFYKTSYVNNFTDEIRYTKRLLQESVDQLIQKERSKTPQKLKSLSDILKGKKGRFRQNLLGKRVDYSGRSVIIVDPELKLHECGLPKKIIIELFQPFIMQYLMIKKYVKTISKAKHIIYSNNPIILTILYRILKNHLVLLNRAPTLHKLGIQAFQPKLMKGKAIRLHPLVCPAFNADFDGDQMGVHIPLSFEARAEAWKLLWSRNNLLFSSTGMPILTPGQDVILGCYYLTSKIKDTIKNSYLRSNHNFSIKKNLLKNFYFNNLLDVIKAYEQEKINIHTEVWVKWNGFVKEDQNFSFMYPNKIEIYLTGFFLFIYPQRKLIYNLNGYRIGQFIKTTVGRVIFNDAIKNIIY